MMPGGATFVAALVEGERRVLIRLRAGVPGDSGDPTVQAEDEVEERLRIAAGNAAPHQPRGRADR
jgi:hypothetical protein